MKSENYILLVVNPIAGSSEKKTIIDSVKIEAVKQGYQFKLYQTTGKEDEKAIKSIIEDISPARVIVAGGDGTISLVAQCVFETEIILGIIPAGSANGMAVNFGLPETLEEQITIAFSDCKLKIDALFINGQICLHIADLGINAELVKNYETSGVRGKLGYFLQSIPTLINSDSPFHFTIKTGDEIVEVSGILLAIANANKFGTGATINPHGKVNDGKFEVLVFKNLDFIEIFKTMRDQPDMSSDFVQIISTENATLKSHKKIPFQIDGEYMGEVNEVNVSVAQEKLLMALPEKFCKLHST